MFILSKCGEIPEILFQKITKYLTILPKLGVLFNSNFMKLAKFITKYLLKKKLIYIHEYIIIKISKILISFFIFLLIEQEFQTKFLLN